MLLLVLVILLPVLVILIVVHHLSPVLAAVETAALAEDGHQAERFLRVQEELIESVAPELETGGRLDKEIVLGGVIVRVGGGTPQGEGLAVDPEIENF